MLLDEGRESAWDRTSLLDVMRKWCRKRGKESGVRKLRWHGLLCQMRQRRTEGDSLKLEVMREAPELVVHERMSQGEGVKGPKEKK